MGNGQSQPEYSEQQQLHAGGIQLTHEQWQQYQLFIQNQRAQQSQPQQMRPVRQSQPQQQQQMRAVFQTQQAPQQPQQPQQAQQLQHLQQQQVHRQSVPPHLQRTQVKLTNNNIDQKIIPNMQQKSHLPSVENTFQDAYQQRLNDQFTMGGTRQMQQPIHQQYQQQQLPQQQYQQPPRQPQQLPRQQQQSKPTNKQFMEELDEIYTLKYNPAQILGLQPGTPYTEKEIKTAYRNLAMKHHPDKGGNEEIFKLLTKAYLALIKENEGNNYVEKTFMDLKSGVSQSTHPQQSHQPNSMGGDDDFDVNKFNQFFETNRLDDVDFDNGYGDWKTTDTSEKPKQIFNQKFSNEIFNTVFNELTHNENSKNPQNSANQQIQVYEEPQPLSVNNRIGYSNLDYRKTDDYSKEYDIQDGSSKNGIYFTDYKKAYTQTTLVNPNTIQERKAYKDVEDLSKARETQDFTMTEADRILLEKKKQQAEAIEAERLMRLRSRDDQLTNHSARVSKLLYDTNTGAGTKTLEYNRKQ
jgi:curved DNA-binding protein CbpA